MKRMIVIVLMAACGSSPGMNAQGDDGPMPDAPNGSNGSNGSNSGGIDAPTGSANKTIFTIVLENHDYDEIVGSANAPYINSLIAMGALATNYKDTAHPSLPNYLHMISGDNQYPGFVDIDPNAGAVLPGDQAEPRHAARGRAHQVALVSGEHGHAVQARRTPATTRRSTTRSSTSPTCRAARTVCARRRTSTTRQFAADLATNTYRYMWITPNLDNDGHDPTTDPVAGPHRRATRGCRTRCRRSSRATASRPAASSSSRGTRTEGRNGDDPSKIPMIILSPQAQVRRA